MTKRKTFELVKVVDPHKNMPKDIKEKFFDGMQCNDDMLHNDTHVWWTVGEYDYVTEDADDDDLEGPGDRDLKLVDDWMLENGFEKKERVLVLYWW